MSHFDFDAEPVASEPAATFTLGGRVWKVRNGEGLPFDFLRRMLTTPTASTDPEEAARAAAGMVVQVETFFRTVLVPEQAEAFTALLAEPDSPVTVGRLRPLMTWIVEQVMGSDGDPTIKPSSSAGRRRTGSTSKAGSSSRASRRRVS